MVDRQGEVDGAPFQRREADYLVVPVDQRSAAEPRDEWGGRIDV